MPPSFALSARTWLVAGLALTIAFGVSLTLVVWADWRRVAAAAVHIGLPALVLVLGTSLACYAIRFLRWHGFTRRFGHAIPWTRNLQIFVAGLALTATPGKSGELVRAPYLAREGVPYSHSLLLFYWDRLCDLGGILLLAAASTPWLSSAHRTLLSAALAVVTALWLLRPGGAMFARAVTALRRRLPRQRARWLEPLSRLRHSDSRIAPALVVAGVAAGTLAYSMHAVAFVILAQAAGFSLSLPSAALVLSVSALAGAAILLPAGAGLVETTSIGLLMLQGLPPADAVAVGLIHRAGTFWFAIALGSGALAGLTAFPRRA
jgi:uncharacterized protein (TIRG00374 family)